MKLSLACCFVVVLLKIGSSLLKALMNEEKLSLTGVTVFIQGLKGGSSLKREKQ